MTHPPRTLAEIRATCTKAARGAGCPWGLAEEAGMAAKRLQSHGLPGAETLARLFDTPRHCPCSGDGPAKCGLRELAVLSDAPPEETLMMEAPVAAPLLLAATLLDLAREGDTWQLDWASGRAICTAQGIATQGKPAPAIAQTLRISKTQGAASAAAPTLHSRRVDPMAWDRLTALADKTYVPETEASRSAGAGPDAAETD